MAKGWDRDMKAIDKSILLALADYADDNGVCWPRQRTIAMKTGVTRQTVNQKMKEMERTGLLAKSDGRTILFPVGETDTTVGEADTKEGQAGRQESQAGRQGCQPDRHPSKPSSNHQVNTKENYENQAEVIYAEYPRNVGKPDAILKIISALKKTKDFGKLLSRTKQYAQVTVNKEKKFIPHPATWFNQERYNDNPDEWSDWQDKEDELQKLKHQLEYERDPDKFQQIKERIRALG